MPDPWPDQESPQNFNELADAAAAGRPQFLRHNGQVLILIAKDSLEEACLAVIRTQRPGAAPPEPLDDGRLGDNTYQEARGLLNAALRRRS